MPDANSTSIKSNVIDRLSDELGKFIESKSSTFACGGTINIKTPDNESSNITSNRIALRWDSPNSAHSISKVVFPVNSDSRKNLVQLVADCQPASFGYKGQNVLDDSYRKAIKMDRSAFSVDLCPYELGIVDTIVQMLLPNVGKGVDIKGVRAELYKLNIYGAPSGFFKAHVDTPRSETQFGSLVVSLPSSHRGGQLIVRHAGQLVTFDWGTPAGSETIGWAAFYSDCEHEVLEVTEGHRVTLTYNLYYVPGAGNLAGNHPVMDVTTLALYHKVKDALMDPTFMAEGGYLGVGCQHAYAHATSEGIASLPGVLKGSDMAVYSVFLALGLDVTVRSVLDTGYHKEYLMEDEDNGNTVSEDDEFLSKRLHKLIVTEAGGYEDANLDDILGGFRGEWLKVNWLTRPANHEANLIHLTYGNEAGVNCLYSGAALVISVPSALNRGAIQQ